MTVTESGGELPSEALAPGLTPLQRARAILGGSAGNFVEWYDWFVYSSFALYFAKHFFPKGDETAQLLQAAHAFLQQACTECDDGHRRGGVDECDVRRGRRLPAQVDPGAADPHA